MNEPNLYSLIIPISCRSPEDVGLIGW